MDPSDDRAYPGSEPDDPSDADSLSGSSGYLSNRHDEVEMNAKAWLNSSPVHLSTILSVISHLRICRSLHRLTTTCFLKIDVVLFNKPHHRCCLYSLYIDRRKLGTVTVWDVLFPTMEAHGRVTDRRMVFLPLQFHRRVKGMVLRWHLRFNESLRKSKNTEDGLEFSWRGVSAKTVEGINGASEHQRAKASYASMVSRKARTDKNVEDGGLLREDEVVVLDEDCLVDHAGSYPTICFSDRVHEQIDRCMRNVIVIHLLGRAIG
ncbi:hypothetical protein GQ457_12G000250 [Hibiscus cannabinus]